MSESYQKITGQWPHWQKSNGTFVLLTAKSNRHFPNSYWSMTDVRHECIPRNISHHVSCLRGMSPTVVSAATSIDGVLWKSLNWKDIFHSHQWTCKNWPSTFPTILVCEEWAFIIIIVVLISAHSTSVSLFWLVLDNTRPCRMCVNQTHSNFKRLSPPGYRG